MIAPSTIYEYIKSEEANFDTNEINVFQNWPWNFKRHVDMSLSLKHGIFVQGDNVSFLRPFKKVIEPILTLRYRAEDIELKDVNLYTEDENGRALSFLIKKYHDEVYVKEHNLDSFFDEAGEENIDLGGVLVQYGKDGPEVLPLQFIAFCDQTDIMGGPIGFKYYFSPDKLRDMASVGWGETKNGATTSIEELILLAQFEKSPSGDIGQKKNKTTGKNIEVYIVHGSLPESYLNKSYLNNGDEDLYINQVQIVAFYTDKEGKRNGITLYCKKEDDDVIQFFSSMPIRGRALGTGGAEALFHEQIWTNFLEIHKMNLLEATSKNVLYTDDPNYKDRNKIVDMENNEITTIMDGKRIFRVPTEAPISIALFEKSINEWYRSAQAIGISTDPMMGQHSPGMTYRGQQGLIAQGMEIHQYRRGKFAKFIEMIYQMWIIPDIIKKILKGKRFLATLSADELHWVMEKMSENHANSVIKDQILNGQTPTDRATIIQQFKDEFTKKGNKHILEILKDEFRDVDIKLSINIVGKQKNMGEMVDKLMKIFQLAFANPQNFQAVMQMPGMSESFNSILEYSGLSEVDFASLSLPPTPPATPQPSLAPSTTPITNQPVLT